MTYHRKVIRIKGSDSPNVRRALFEIEHGLPVSHEEVVPGVLSYSEYLYRLKYWDKIRVCIGIHAEFYEGAEVLLYPPEWLNLSEQRALELKGHAGLNPAVAIGIDPAEGGDKTAMAAVGYKGLVELVSRKTPDTNVIVNEAIAFMIRHKVIAQNVAFDKGGGGTQHAQRMRAQGHPGVRAIGFGEAVIREVTRRAPQIKEKMQEREERYEYLNRRAQMYGELSELMDPSINDHPFAIPKEYTELRRQLAPIPKWYDKEGRLFLPPKNRKPGQRKEDGILTLTDLLGCSPDEADATVLAVHAMLHKPIKRVAGGY